jgi:hypothetical protein
MVSHRLTLTLSIHDFFGSNTKHNEDYIIANVRKCFLQFCCLFVARSAETLIRQGKLYSVSESNLAGVSLDLLS